jgi:membrane-bound metal-dependent hydrolase YbcI (DUF457 family)
MDFWHRSLTHSIFVILSILVGFSRFGSAKNNFSNKYFGYGLCLGMLFHSLSDIIYLKGVLIFFPFDLSEIFYELDFGFILRFEKYSLPIQKYLMTMDHLTDCFFYLFVIMVNERDFTFFKRLCLVQSTILIGFLFAAKYFSYLTLEVFVSFLYVFALLFVCFNVYSPIYFFNHLIDQEKEE